MSQEADQLITGADHTGIPGHYTGLSKELAEIRLLWLLPSKSDGMLRCSMRSYSLNLAPPYIALSYAWGSSIGNRAIQIIGRPKHVRLNLWQFLSHASKASRYQHEQKIWIDALCIDQSNLTERSHQVGLMGSIYRSAQLVIAWLGHSEAKSELAALRYLNSKKRDIGRIWLKTAGLGVRQLSKREYWSRLWVAQELQLARDVVLACGPVELSWKLFADFMKVAQAPLPGLYYTMAEREAYLKSPAPTMVGNLRQEHQYDLYQQIIEFGHLHCTEPRDRIFALLHVAHTPSGEISADYTLTLPILLHNVLRDHHIHYKPTSLGEVVSQCRELAERFPDVDLRDSNKTMASLIPPLFSNPGHYNQNDHDLSTDDIPWQRFSMLVWAQVNCHEPVLDLWSKAYTAQDIVDVLERSVEQDCEDLALTVVSKVPQKEKCADAVVQALIKLLITQGKASARRLLSVADAVMPWLLEEAFNLHSIPGRATLLVDIAHHVGYRGEVGVTEQLPLFVAVRHQSNDIVKLALARPGLNLTSANCCLLMAYALKRDDNIVAELLINSEIFDVNASFSAGQHWQAFHQNRSGRAVWFNGSATWDDLPGDSYGHGTRPSQRASTLKRRWPTLRTEQSSVPPILIPKPPLLEAVFRQNEHVVTLMLGRRDLEVNIRDQDGMDAIVLALKADARRQAASSGRTALETSTAADAIIRLLIEREDLDINNVCRDFKRSPTGPRTLSVTLDATILAPTLRRDFEMQEDVAKPVSIQQWMEQNYVRRHRAAQVVRTLCKYCSREHTSVLVTDQPDWICSRCSSMSGRDRICQSGRNSSCQYLP